MVSLGGDIEAELPFLRSEAESMMRSRCIIRRNGEKVFSEETGDYETTVTTLYTGSRDGVEIGGICKIRFGGAQANEVDGQSQDLTEQVAVLSLPIAGSSGLTVGDVAEIVSSPFDPDLVGKLFRILGHHTQTYATARRLPVEVVSGG